MAVTGSRSSSDGRRSTARTATKTAGNGRGRAREQAPQVTERLARLTTVRPGRHRVVSCYLKLEPRDRSRGKYLIKLKNRVREVTQGLPRLGLPREVQEAIGRDLDRVQQHLASPANLPSTQGVALFACEAPALWRSTMTATRWRAEKPSWTMRHTGSRCAARSGGLPRRHSCRG